MDGNETAQGPSAGSDRIRPELMRFESDIYRCVPHPHVARRHREGPVKVRDAMHWGTPIARFNSRFALIITVAVGSMWCAYVFTVLALISLPGAIATHNTIVIVAWIAQTFIQLVLLPIIIVGQNIQAEASDKRAQQTYDDAEAVLHEALQIQDHLCAQDNRLGEIIAAIRTAYPYVGGESAPASS
jgi:hypothetical protein